MPRGGVRNGTPGKAYGNRSDLTAAKPIPGGQYGEMAQQQQVIDAGPGTTTPPGPPPVGPGGLGAFDRPTERPAEPLTHGAPFGPGAPGMTLPQPPDPLTQGLALLNQIPNLPVALQVVRDQLKMSTL